MNFQQTLPEPARAEVDAWGGPAVIEFGSQGCGICRAAQPAIEAARVAYPRLPYTRVEDGPGRPLGRSFRVKLWPTLVFMLDGRETARLVRPTSAAIAEAFANLAREASQAQPAPGAGACSAGQAEVSKG